jgi:curved DNA-binding protein CbpA
MPKVVLPSDWLSRFSDPYAVLGIPITADDRRITKRLRVISKALHPDLQSDDTTQELATLMLSKVVNPAYERLKQEKGRNEIKALLRLYVRKLNRDQSWQPDSEIARELLRHPASNVEVFYEQTVSALAESQYQPLTPPEFESRTQQLIELNLAYLQLTMGEGLFRSERRTGVVPAADALPQKFTPVPAQEVRQESYDRRHYRRANQYMKRKEWAPAVQELREAIKIKANEADYHALLGVAYHCQGLNSMAKVYLRQALKLVPNHALAVKYAPRLGLDLSGPGTPGKAKPPVVHKNGSSAATGSRQNGREPEPSPADALDQTPSSNGAQPGPAPRKSISYVSPKKSGSLMEWLRRLWGESTLKK